MARKEMSDAAKLLYQTHIGKTTVPPPTDATATTLDAYRSRKSEARPREAEVWVKEEHADAGDDAGVRGWFIIGIIVGFVGLCVVSAVLAGFDLARFFTSLGD